MFISAETLDDALLKLYPALLARSRESMTIKASRGETAEVIGALIEIRNPRARLSRSETRGKLYSSLGELLWYLSKDNRLDFIAPYVPRYSDESEDGVTIYGGYGPRLFGPNGEGQVKRVIGLLTERPTSRRAVIQIFDKEDIANNHKEVPCTTTLQCFVRDEKLDMVVTMRSNDAYFGLPHDVFCFTMLQEIIARSLCRDVGCYRHFAGSMHIYKERWDDAQHFVDEGYQQRIAMPEMPVADPWPSISAVLDAERRIRDGDQLEASSLGLQDYWSDLVRILQIFFAKGDQSKITTLAEQISFRRYRPYILGRIRSGGEA
ncbi:thymidylate synthase [Bradyrhizobium elkanii]|uniref:thymidylate synthase n=1 Tax=Bradyrhizobium elkanii TaxID=29448 RepID=UPI00272C9F99|nr:thymidylate synthase [Bradyrhizobium elkanii]WLA81971.1 thymidylate synthase [Bradyrhizobium elkanii]